MTDVFRPATAPRKLNIALTGHGGAGKTYSALQLATALFPRVALIDTDHGSSANYSRLFAFNMAELQRPFTPEAYLKLLQAAEAYPVVIIDSLSPEWDGPGGCLEIVHQIAEASSSNNTYTAWKTVTPRHQALLNWINWSPPMVISTLRAKPKHVMEKKAGEKKTTITKDGDRSIMRDDFEYEFDLALELDKQHYATVFKTRLIHWPVGSRFLMDGAVAQWCQAYLRGDPLPMSAGQRNRLGTLVQQRGWSREQVMAEMQAVLGPQPADLKTLMDDQARRLIAAWDPTAETPSVSAPA